MIQQSTWPDAALAEAVFLTALADLEDGYRSRAFKNERDVVSWLHHRICTLAPAGLTVRQDFPLIGKHPDLVLLSGEQVLLAAEFTYEPCPSRTDLDTRHARLKVWSEVEDDLTKTEIYVREGAAPISWAICIDEGGRHTWRSHAVHSVIRHWTTGYRTEVTMTRWPAGPGGPLCRAEEDPPSRP